MTNQEIFTIAMQQSAIDLNCKADDFLQKESRIVISKKNEAARRYLELPFVCNLVSYGNNVVASVQKEYEELVREYIEKYPMEHCFETPNMHVLNDAFEKHDMRVCFMAEYFLPDVSLLKEIYCGYEHRILEQKDFSNLYVDEWSNALCADRKHLDVLGVGVYDAGKLIGLAACSADCDTMWQIGVDILPEYRRKGIASAITMRLALEILKRGKVPFYCCAWSNIRSAGNAFKSGFRPAWAELTIKNRTFVDKMNEIK